MNFKYLLSAKISRQLARGRLLSWQIWFQQFDFDVEWMPGNSNFLADSLTRYMNKVFVPSPRSFFIITGKGPQDDNFNTFVDKFKILESHVNHLTEEIKKVVGLRLRRNQWILRCQAWQSKNVGISLGLDADLVKVYPFPNMKVKIYFKSLSDLWFSQFTENMIWILKALNYYKLIGGIDFASSIYTRTQILDLEAIPIKGELKKYVLSLKIPDILKNLKHLCYKYLMKIMHLMTLFSNLKFSKILLIGRLKKDFAGNGHLLEHLNASKELCNI